MATNTTAVVLIWSPPQDSGGIGVVFYTVYYQAVDGSLKTTLGNITTTFVTVTNLSPATEYMMTVVADNGVAGDEANSSVSINITVTTQSVATCKSVVEYCFLCLYMCIYKSKQYSITDLCTILCVHFYSSNHILCTKLYM